LNNKTDWQEKSGKWITAKQRCLVRSRKTYAV